MAYITTRSLSSREFNHDTARAKRESLRGPVVITDRGEPTHVLMSHTEFLRLTNQDSDFLVQLGKPEGVAEIEFALPRIPDTGRAAEFL